MRQNSNDSRFLKTGHYLGLKFDQGWWFTQVVGTEYVEVKPMVLLNEDESRAVIASSTESIATDEIEDSQDRRVLEPNDDERNTIFQLMYGIAPSRMQTYTLYGRDRPKSAQDYDAPGEPAAYVTGFDSPYNNPSRQAEAFYVNSMSPLRIQAFNPMDEAEEARLSFHVNKLRYTTVTDESLMKAMLQGQQPARLVELGEGVQNRDQVAIPSWLNEAFSEHIMTTDEILSSEPASGGTSSPLPSDATELQRSGN